MSKLYLGFKLSPEVTAHVNSIIENHCSRRTPLVPTPADRIHITTLFLGDTELEVAKQILDFSTEGFGRSFPFGVFIGEPQSFPRVLYLEVIESIGRLASIRSRQYNEFVRLTGRTPWPKIYNPHLTLAKAEGKVNEEELQDAIDFAKHRIGPGPERWSEVTALGVYEKSECLYEVSLG